MAKGYGVAHVKNIHDMESFGKYWEATAPLGERGDNKVLSAGEAARTLEGETMKFSAVLEFETYEKALSY